MSALPENDGRSVAHVIFEIDQFDTSGFADDAHSNIEVATQREVVVQELTSGFILLALKNIDDIEITFDTFHELTSKVLTEASLNIDDIYCTDETLHHASVWSNAAAP